MQNYYNVIKMNKYELKLYYIIIRIIGFICDNRFYIIF